MKICHVCFYECEDDKELCPVCGAELKGEESGIEEVEEIVINDPVLAVSVEDVVTAEIYRDILKENKIPFVCDSAESDGSMRVLFGGSFVTEDIYVDSLNLEKAQALYEEVLNSDMEFETEFEEEFYEEDNTEIE
ncbi:MAG: DUF2007 domain-containing protein [Oscillospiraceae bacterium]|nr:DUF2007 domain-containing protein [Oscillospiraceae bacterium]